MNYKISFAALAVASVLSSQAMAGAAADAVNALIATGGTITPSGYAGLDGDVNTSTTAWATVADDAAACALGGVLCSGTDITKLEIPNAGFLPPGGLPAVLTAIDPIKATLVNLNLSNLGGLTNNAIGSGMTGLDNFTALEKLALNNALVSGVVPDMSAATSLNWINIGDNPGITGMGAKLAGGDAISLIGANNNAAMAGDMTATLANIAHPASLTLNATKLYGSVVLADGDSVALSGTDIVPSGDAAAITASGYDETTVVQAATSVSAGDGEGTISVSWVAPSVGAQTGYNVSYSSDDGETLEGTTAVPGANTQTYTLTNVPVGTYKAVVQATGPDNRMSSAAKSNDFTSSSGSTSPVCGDDQELNEAGTECVDKEEPPVKSGGGAALWLALLPLMGLLRRKRA